MYLHQPTLTHGGNVWEHHNQVASYPEPGRDVRVVEHLWGAAPGHWGSKRQLPLRRHLPGSHFQLLLTHLLTLHVVKVTLVPSLVVRVTRHAKLTGGPLLLTVLSRAVQSCHLKVALVSTIYARCLKL